jgi:hypothetical protein
MFTIPENDIQKLESLECEASFPLVVGADDIPDDLKKIGRVPCCVIQTKLGHKRVARAFGQTHEEALDAAMAMVNPGDVPRGMSDIVKDNADKDREIAALRSRLDAPIMAAAPTVTDTTTATIEAEESPPARILPYPTKGGAANNKRIREALKSRGLPLPDANLNSRHFTEEAVESLKKHDAAIA